MSDVALNPVVAQQVAAFRDRAPAAEPEWLGRRRDASLQRFAELGLPTRREEAWRFTDLRKLVTVKGLPLPVASVSGAVDAASLTPHLLAGKTHRIVLVNGVFNASLSAIGELPSGITLGSLAQIAARRPDLARAAFDVTDAHGGQSFASLNAAWQSGGFVLALDPGVMLEHPVEVLHVTTEVGRAAHHLRSAILAASDSRASVVETYVGQGSGWTNAVTTVEVGRGAVLRHVKVQAESEDAVHLALLRAELADQARYETFLLVTGALLSRQDVQAVLSGESANFVLNGAYLLQGDQEATIAPLVDHQVKGGQTAEVLKGVLAGSAHGVFLGSVKVHEGADDTDARQLNCNLMLSPTARVDTKPELTIHADEVKCSHGATVGDLDEAALFYLVSRGIAPATARHMLVEAFAADVFDLAALAPAIDTHARRYLTTWLDTARLAAPIA